MPTDAHPDNVLFEWYGRYIGDPDEETDVYLGFALFFGGIALGAVGILVFLLSGAAGSPDQPAWALREVAVVASAAGLPALLLGIVVLLPGDRRMTYAALAGVAVCLTAIALFVSVYPMNWNVEHTPDYSAQGVGLYAVGLVGVVGATGAALVGHQVERAGAGAAGAAGEGSAAAGSDDGATETVSEERVRRDIDEAMADAELSWGGVHKTETRTLELHTETPEGLRTNVDRVGAETTTAGGTDVDEAVSGLRQLQGRDRDVDSGTGVDEQTAALTELKRQRKVEATAGSDERRTVDRLRDFIGL